MRRVIELTQQRMFLADPTILSPEETPDHLWHLYCHSAFGIEEHISKDGIHWDLKRELIKSILIYPSGEQHISKYGTNLFAIIGYFAKLALSKDASIKVFIRPYLYCENGVYYMYYQEMEFKYRRGKFHIAYAIIKCIHSKDLEIWSEPITVLGETGKYKQIACPSVLKSNGKLFMYFSYGALATGNNSLVEPRYVAIAESIGPESKFEIKDDVKFIEDGIEYNSITAIRTHKIKSQTFYTCVQLGKENGKYTATSKALQIESPTKFTITKDLFKPNTINNLGLSDTYVSELIYFEEKVWIYFNARSTNKLFDKFGKQYGFLSIFYLLIKNIFLNKEEIYLQFLDLEELKSS